jgi:hypothetical protein
VEGVGSNEKYRYRPLFNIRCVDDLMATLDKNPSGLVCFFLTFLCSRVNRQVLNDIADSYSNIRQDVA